MCEEQKGNENLKKNQGEHVENRSIELKYLVDRLHRRKAQLKGPSEEIIKN